MSESKRQKRWAAIQAVHAETKKSAAYLCKINLISMYAFSSIMRKADRRRYRSLISLAEAGERGEGK